jgi:EmrB/QacA subfamily drug resistance transporter
MSRKWLTLLAVSLASLLMLMGVTAANVALPDIQRDLDASFNELRWVIDAYALSVAVTMLIFGSLADRLGRRRVFAIGVALFSLSSLACGLAWSATALDLLRGVQGVGGAALLATSLALIGAAYSGRDRNTALALWGATTAGAMAIGPLVGGALVEAIGWEAIFFVNVPVGLLIGALIAGGVPESRDPDATGRPDYAGLVTITGSMVLLVLALFRGNDHGWGSPLILGLFGSALVLLGVFVVIERRLAKPLLDLGMLAKPSTIGTSAGIFAIGLSVFATFTFLALYIQNTLGFNAMETGLRLFALTVSTFVAGTIVGRLAGRIPLRLLLSSALAVTGVGLLLLLWEVDPGSDWTALLAGGILIGAGTGAAIASSANVALAASPRARAGMASGVNNTFRMLGVAIGIAALGAVLESRVGERLGELLPGVETGALVGVVSTGAVDAAATAAPAGVRPEVAAAATDAFVSGLGEVFLVAALVAFASAALALVLVRERDLRE